MALKVLNTLIFLLLRAFLWAATLCQAGSILWSLAYATPLPDKLRPPALWEHYLNPFGTDSNLFQVYLAALIFNLFWDTLWNTVLSHDHSEHPKPGFFKPTLGDYTLAFWVFLVGVAHTFARTGVSPKGFGYLYPTLAACFLLWALQKAIQWVWKHRNPPVLHLVLEAQPKGVLIPPPVISEPLSTHPPELQRKGEPKVPAKARPPKPPKVSLKAKRQKEGMEKLMAFIQSKGQAQTADMAEALGTTTRTILRYVGILVAEGRLEKVGENRDTAYRIKPIP